MGISKEVALVQMSACRIQCSSHLATRPLAQRFREALHRSLRNKNGHNVKFSVVTISFNQGHYLEEAMRSVLQQRDAGVDLEYIVVDPGSTDGSRQILEMYEGEIDQLILEPDEGPADGLNKGFALATGDVLGFINADDLLEPGSLTAVLGFFVRNPDAQAVTGVLRIIDGKGNPSTLSRLPFESVKYPPRLTLRAYLDRRMTILQQSTFFRRSAWEAVSGFNVANTVSWDSELFADMLLAGIEFNRISSILASFRIHGESLTGSRSMSDQVRMNWARVRQNAVAAGHRPSPPGLVQARQIAWRIRPGNRFRGWLAGRMSR